MNRSLPGSSFRLVVAFARSLPVIMSEIDIVPDVTASALFHGLLVGNARVSIAMVCESGRRDIVFDAIRGMRQ